MSHHDHRTAYGMIGAMMIGPIFAQMNEQYPQHFVAIMPRASLSNGMLFFSGTSKHKQLEENFQ